MHMGAASACEGIESGAQRLVRRRHSSAQHAPARVYAECISHQPRRGRPWLHWKQLQHTHSFSGVLQPAMTAVSAAQPSRVVGGPSSTTSYHPALQPCRTTHALPPRPPCRFPNVDSDDFADEAERDEFYRLAGEVARAMAGEPQAGSQRTRNSRGAGSSRRGRGRGRGGGGAAAAGQGQPVPGWEATGQYTQRGQQLFSGTCSSCGQPCTVPFRPIQGRSAPCCYSCHHGGSDSKQQRDTQAAAAAEAAPAEAAPAEAATAVDDHACKKWRADEL